MTLTTVVTGTQRPAPKKVEPLDITVLAGGPGLEREVSLMSGAAVYEALQRLGHQVVMCDIGPDDLSALERPADFVFIALHGEFGEDGTVQAELEARDLPYSGTNSAASRMAMDKVLAKRRFMETGLPTPRFEVVDRERLVELGSQSPVPAVVKPTASGSSVDTTIVREPGELRRAAANLIEKYGLALVERYIDGPELTVGVLDNTALPVCEIQTNREFYDYQAKYFDDSTQYLFDLDLPEAFLGHLQALSMRAYQALGCAVFGRVDWMVEAATQEPYLLEINTIPGFTSHSLVPKAAARIGITFDELCQRIVEVSLDRWKGVKKSER